MVPALHTLVSFCDRAYNFLEEHPSNMLAIHCQGGKGRSGLFASSVMLWCGYRETASECLSQFRNRRTDRSIKSRAEQGVSAPCQVYAAALPSTTRLPPPNICVHPCACAYFLDVQV